MSLPLSFLVVYSSSTSSSSSSSLAGAFVTDQPWRSSSSSSSRLRPSSAAASITTITANADAKCQNVFFRPQFSMSGVGGSSSSSRSHWVLRMTEDDDEEEEDDDDEEGDDSLDADDSNPLARGIDSVSWLPSVNDAPAPANRGEDDDTANAEILPLFPLGGIVYTPNSEHILNIFEPRYRQMYNDILMNGSKRFVVSMCHPAEEGRFARMGVLFTLEELKEVSGVTADRVKYICNHRVAGRVKIHEVVNPDVWESRESYLKVRGTIIDDTGHFSSSKNSDDDDNNTDDDAGEDDDEISAMDENISKKFVSAGESSFASSPSLCSHRVIDPSQHNTNNMPRRRHPLPYNISQSRRRHWPTASSKHPRRRRWHDRSVASWNCSMI